MNQMNFPKKPPGNSDPNAPTKQPASALTIGLFVALAFWVISISAGTFIFGEVKDWRKPVLVLIPMILFLSLWGSLLVLKYLESKKNH